MSEMTKIAPDDIESSPLVEMAFEFWYKDNDHIRSPFPKYIRNDARKQTLKKFKAWLTSLEVGAEKEVDETVVSEKLEEYLFESAMALVLTEDEKLTLLYPNLPRVNEQLNVKDEGDDQPLHTVKDRSIVTEGDERFFRVLVTHPVSGEDKEVKFPLPY